LPGANVQILSISPDGRAVAGITDMGDLIVASLAGERITQMFVGVSPTSLPAVGLSWDHKAVAICSSVRISDSTGIGVDIYALDGSGKHEFYKLPLPQNRRYEWGQISWHPAGKIVLVEQAGMIFVVNRANGSLTSLPGELPAWSPSALTA
jgi:hypothetical protein